ncbi:MAG: hypothetical protein CMO80_15495 [Verrucomicrobiales bacterium]|nr:hypothetical protein [Verrucomicrobiales bacterium]
MALRTEVTCTFNLIAKAPALEDLIVVNMPHLSVADFKHKKLSALDVAIGSKRKNQATPELLGIHRSVKSEFKYRRR